MGIIIWKKGRASERLRGHDMPCHVPQQKSNDPKTDRFHATISPSDNQEMLQVVSDKNGLVEVATYN